MADGKPGPVTIGAAVVAGLGVIGALFFLDTSRTSPAADAPATSVPDVADSPALAPAPDPGSFPSDTPSVPTPPPVPPTGAAPTPPAADAQPQGGAATRSASAGTAQRMQPATAANVIAFDDESLSFEARMPGGAAGDPVIAYLQKDAEGYLRRIKFNARTDFDRIKRERRTPERWEVRVVWAYLARSGDLVSLMGEASEYTGGAGQPRLLFDTHIANAKTGEDIELQEMFKPPFSPSPATVSAACEALKAAKRARIKAETILDEPIICVGPRSNIRLDQAQIALAPSNVPDRFGGLYIYYAPEVIGSRAEGDYRILVEQEVFLEDLRPAYRSAFAGTAPAPK